MSLVMKLKHNPYFQTIVIVAAAAIVVYTIYPYFTTPQKSHTPKMENVVPKNVIVSHEKVDVTKPSYNKKRREEELDIEHKKGSDVGEVFIKKMYDVNGDGEKTGNVYSSRIDITRPINIKIDKEPKKEDTSPLKIEEPKKEEEPKVIKPDDLVIVEKKEGEDIVVKKPDDIIVPQKAQEEKEQELMLYTMLYNDNNSVDVGESYVKENSDPINSVSNNNSNNSVEEDSDNIKIIPGSSFNGELLVSQNSLYKDNVKAIIKLTDGPLTDYILIGKSEVMADDSGLIIKLDKLVDPTNGDEQSIEAIAINIKDLTPRFVDELDRHLVPRVVLATIGSLMDQYTAKDTEMYEQPTSLLSEEMKKELNRYTPEIKVNRQLVTVIFY